MPAPIVPNPTTPTFTRAEPNYESGTELLQRAHECCPESLVPIGGDRHPHETQGALAVAARVCLGLRKCPLPASGACRRYQGRSTLDGRALGRKWLWNPWKMWTTPSGVESRLWMRATAPWPSRSPTRRETWYRVTGLRPGNRRARTTRRSSRRSGATHGYPLARRFADGGPCPLTSRQRPRRTTPTAAPTSGRSTCSSGAQPVRRAQDRRPPPRPRPILGRLLGPGVRAHAPPGLCALETPTRPPRSPTSSPGRTGCALLPPEVEETLRRHEEGNNGRSGV